MKDASGTRIVTVSTAGAAALITDRRYRAALSLFMQAPTTLREASDRAGTDLKRLHRMTQKLCAFGLLTVVGTRPRNGRAMKLYRSVADAFLVRDEILPGPLTDGLAAELRESMMAHDFRPGRGMLISLDPNGRQRLNRVHVEDGERPVPVLDLWFAMNLRPSDLPDLRRELLALRDRFERGTDGGATPFLVHAAAAPRLHEIS